jgi:hypothetical protein
LTETEQDIFEVDVSTLGIPRRPAVPITELNAPEATDGSPNLRRHGLERLLAGSDSRANRRRRHLVCYPAAYQGAVVAA